MTRSTKQIAIELAEKCGDNLPTLTEKPSSQYDDDLAIDINSYIKTKAALKVLEDEGYICIDELIERAEKEFEGKSCMDLQSEEELTAYEAHRFLKQIKTEGKG